MNEKYFGLGAGHLYIAPLSVSEAEVRSEKWCAGPTKGGVTLAYAAKNHDITGWDGSLVRSIRYGERLRLTGKLSRLYPRMLSALTGSPVSAAGTAVFLGGRLPEGRHSRLRVMLVCELPAEVGGGEIVFSFRATAASGASITLSPQRDSSWSFDLTAETDGAGFAGRMVVV